MSEVKPYVEDCVFWPREGETLFTVTAAGEIVPTMRGYAIIPRDEYDRLRRTDRLLAHTGITLTETSDGARWSAGA